VESDGNLLPSGELRLNVQQGIEYTVLGAVDDGINNVEAIRERVLSNVRAFSGDQEDAVDDAIGRLVGKQILERDGDTIRLH